MPLPYRGIANINYNLNFHLECKSFPHGDIAIGGSIRQFVQNRTAADERDGLESVGEAAGTAVAGWICMDRHSTREVGAAFEGTLQNGDAAGNCRCLGQRGARLECVTHICDTAGNTGYLR